jgi:hypothetical protein
MKKIYVAKVHGEYITQDGKERKLKSYSASFRMFDIENALSVIKGKLLMPFLKATDSGAIAPYSWHLDEIKPEQGAADVNEIPLHFQTFLQLDEYCKRNKLPVPVTQYSDLDRCREHVAMAKENPDTFKIVFESYKKNLVEDQELAELNRDFIGIGSIGADIDVDPESGRVAPKATSKKRKKQTEEDIDVLK